MYKIYKNQIVMLNLLFKVCKLYLEIKFYAWMEWLGHIGNGYQASLLDYHSDL